MQRGGKWRALAIAGALLLGGGASAVAGAAEESVPEQEFVPGQVIVRYEAGVASQERAQARADVGAVSARPIAVARTEVLRLPRGRSVRVAVRRLEARPGVAFAEPDRVYQLEGLPNDPRFGLQWGLNNTGQLVNGIPGAADADVDAPEAWDVTPGSDAVIVGVIDSGVKVDHPDLQPNVFVNAAEAGGAGGVDDDGNGRVDDVTGFDFVNNNGIVSDDANEHGTLVASVIGARGSNGLGVSGVAQQVRILPLQAATAGGGVSTSAAADAVGYARAMGARVINMSFGSFGGGPSPTLTAAMEASPGILFSTSAGNRDPDTNLPNDNDLKPHWPSNLTVDHTNVVASANSTNLDILSSGSSFGDGSVDFAAPGTGIDGAAINESVLKESFDGVTPPGLPAGWTTGGTGAWATTDERADSAPNSVTDSPGANYTNNQDKFVRSPVFNVPNAATCRVEHLRRRRTEAGADFLIVERKIGAGAFSPMQTISGDSAGEEFLLSAPTFTTAGAASVQVQFRLTTDTSVVDDGVHIDDVDVRCPVPEGYRSSSGTSFSSPLTAGVAALLLARDGSLSPSRLKEILRTTADPTLGLASRVITGGRVNANRAVHALDPPPPPVLRDLQAAIVRNLSLVPTTFLPLRAGATVRSAVLRRGSRLRFRVDEPVRVRIQIYARKPGRRVGRRCLAPTRARRRRPRCTRYVSRGVYSMPRQLNGLVRRTFTGRLRGRALRPGPYRLTIRATDLAGNRSRPANKNFRIAKAPRRRR